MNKDFVLYVFVDASAGLDDISEFVAAGVVVLRLHIYHVDKCTAIFDRLHV